MVRRLKARHLGGIGVDREKALGLRPGQAAKLADIMAGQPNPNRQALDWKSNATAGHFQSLPFIPFGERFREGITEGLNAPFRNRDLGMPLKYARPLAKTMAFLSEMRPELAVTEGGYDAVMSEDPEYGFEAARGALSFVPAFNKILGLEKLLEESGFRPSGPDYNPTAAQKAAAHDAAVAVVADPADIGTSGVEQHHVLKSAVPDPYKPLKPEIRVGGTDPSIDTLTAAYDPTMAPPEAEGEAQVASNDPWSSLLFAPSVQPVPAAERRNTGKGPRGLGGAALFRSRFGY